MNIILGIDPGSRVTGYGVIKQVGTKSYYLASGVIRMTATDMPIRLKGIYQGLSQIIQEFQPTCTAIEQVFMHRNVNSALKLGSARGCAVLAASMQDLPVHEYSPRQIKQAVVGYGGAQKSQVQHMVQAILALNNCPPADAADALAVALCHAAQQRIQLAIAAAG